MATDLCFPNLLFIFADVVIQRSGSTTIEKSHSSIIFATIIDLLCQKVTWKVEDPNSAFKIGITKDLRLLHSHCQF